MLSILVSSIGVDLGIAKHQYCYKAAIPLVQPILLGPQVSFLTAGPHHTDTVGDCTKVRAAPGLDETVSSQGWLIVATPRDKIEHSLQPLPVSSEASNLGTGIVFICFKSVNLIREVFQSNRLGRIKYKANHSQS